MDYYDSRKELIYHSCDNCSRGKAIPAANRKSGSVIGAERCAECELKAQDGNCAGEDAEESEEDENGDADEDGDDEEKEGEDN